MNPKKPTKEIKDYAFLRDQIRQTLALSQKRIEQEKVQTYWKIGKLISQHILANDDRAEYGEKILSRLSGDLKLDETILNRTVKFYKSFPIPAARQELTWTHYRLLLTVDDPETRNALAEKAKANQWTTDLLEQKIRDQIALDSNGRSDRTKKLEPLQPKRGALYTFQILQINFLSGKPELVIDLGFKVTKNLSSSSFDGGKFKAGQIVEGVAPKSSGEVFQIAASQRTETELYTYRARVERVVDADTLLVWIDLGFEMGLRQYLRLRGINMPEKDTKQGKHATDFVTTQLKDISEIILCSSKHDIFDRYLADIFIPTPDGEIYLNNLLLEKGFGSRF